MSIQPSAYRADKWLGIEFKLQSVGGVGKLDDLHVVRGKPTDILSRLFIIDDAVFSGQEQQDRCVDLGSQRTKRAVQENTGDHKPCRDLSQTERVVANKLLPMRRGREQLRILQRHG